MYFFEIEWQTVRRSWSFCTIGDRSIRWRYCWISSTGGCSAFCIVVCKLSRLVRRWAMWSSSFDIDLFEFGLRFEWTSSGDRLMISSRFVSLFSRDESLFGLFSSRTSFNEPRLIEVRSFFSLSVKICFNRFVFENRWDQVDWPWDRRFDFLSFSLHRWDRGLIVSANLDRISVGFRRFCCWDFEFVRWLYRFYCSCRCWFS